jgi:hypothetical protein
MAAFAADKTVAQETKSNFPAALPRALKLAVSAMECSAPYNPKVAVIPSDGRKGRVAASSAARSDNATKCRR